MLNKLWNLGHKIDKLFVIDKYNYLGTKLNNYRVLYLSDIVHCINEFPLYVARFVSAEGRVIMIANIIKGECVSILMRSTDHKAFIDIGTTKGVFYGIGDLSPDFKYGDPIILVEGVADRDALVQLYPNILAVKSSSISTLQTELLVALTNKVILAFDNDNAGQHGVESAMSRLKKRGVQCLKLEHPKGIKDSGTILEYFLAKNKSKVKELISYYSSMIEGLILCFV